MVRILPQAMLIYTIIMTIQTSRFKKLFERFILLQFLILLAGIPLVFTSLTRSVFEVNKLLLLDQEFYF